MATTLWLVVHAYSPVLFWDQWELIRTLMVSHGHPSFRDWWAQHNEHRIVTGRLFGFADLYLFGGRNISLLAEIIAIQLCHVALFLFAIRRFGLLPRRVYLTFTGVLLYCLFSPIQMENFVWAFQTVFVLCSLLGTVCCVAVLYAARPAAPVGNSGVSAFLVLAAGCAFVAEVTEANGLLLWVVLLFLAFALRFSRRQKTFLSGAAVLAIAVYFVGYRSPNPPGVITAGLRHPGQVFHFIVTYLGRSWDPQLPTGSAWPSVSESLTALAIVGTVGLSIRALWKPRAFSPLQIVLLGNMLFVLGTAAITALGRMQLGGLQGATAIRYQTPALIFWVSLIAFIALQVDWSRPERLLVAQVTVLILMVAGGGRWFDMGRFAESRQYWPEMAWNAMLEGRFDDPAVGMIYYQPKQLKPLLMYVREHHWGPAGEITSFARLEDISQSPQIDGYRLEPNACLAHWDRARRSGLASVSVGGWALSQSAGRVPRRVAFVSGTGKIIGYAEVDRIRQDVADLHPSATKLKTGWEANLNLPGAGIYHAFLLFDDQRAACSIGGELRIRHFPVF